jgi:serine beta-lactamase-like protein LACTB
MTSRICCGMLLLLPATVGFEAMVCVADSGKTQSKEIPPPEPPAHFLGLIGEYSRDRDKIIVFEKDSKLFIQYGWFFSYSTTEKSKDEYAYRVEFAKADQEFKLTFQRDAKGTATQVEFGSVYQRRKLDGEDGQTFRIKPERPIDDLRKEALAAEPPEEKKEFRATELVDVTTIDATVKLDLRYATDNNFLSTPLYPAIAKAYMQKPAAQALAKVSAKLSKLGYGLLIFDAYRPWYVTRIFYEATPQKLRNFVADPSLGSRHNRGCAVDLTLCDLKTGKPIEMVSGFDEFSDRAFPEYVGGTSRQRWHRDLLRKMMESESFTVYAEEWWHFDFKDWRQYRIGNQTFEELSRKR